MLFLFGWFGFVGVFLEGGKDWFDSFLLSSNTRSRRDEIKPTKRHVESKHRRLVILVLWLFAEAQEEIRQSSWNRGFWSSQNVYPAQEVSEVPVPDSWGVTVPILP